METNQMSPRNDPNFSLQSLTVSEAEKELAKVGDLWDKHKEPSQAFLATKMVAVVEGLLWNVSTTDWLNIAGVVYATAIVLIYIRNGATGVEITTKNNAEKVEIVTKDAAAKIKLATAKDTKKIERTKKNNEAEIGSLKEH